MAGASWNDMNSVMQGMYYGGYPYNISSGSSQQTGQGSTGPAGYFWRGADGKVYVQGDQGINAAGDWNDATENYWSSRNYIRTPDSPTGTNDSNNTNNRNNTSNSPQYADTSAAQAITQGTIDSLGGIRARDLGLNSQEYAGLTNAQGTGRYDIEDAKNLEAYNENVDSNERQRDVSHQAGLQNAAVGRRGLMSTLAAIGALGGTGDVLADRAVAREANLDLGESARTFDSNAKALFDARELMKDEEEQRRLDAEQTFKDRNAAIEYDYAKNMQDNLLTLGGLQADAGQFGQRDATYKRAGEYTSQIAKHSRPSVKEYAKKSLKWAKPALDKYLAGQNDMSVKVDGGGKRPVNGAIYTSTKRREEV